MDASAAPRVGTESAQSPAEAARILEAEILPVPSGATAWAKQPTGVLGLDQYIDAMYDPRTAPRRAASRCSDDSSRRSAAAGRRPTTARTRSS
ncbi:hypothetical protein [Kitasatospora paranensis]|uniref:hypothetical protein n=1 Tax=Kitasatospora paranensis TaxID=258053 RepID=UPI0031EB3A87